MREADILPIVKLLRSLPADSWKRGVNPRVMWPFLPYDFEEKNSLDYFGGEKAA